MSSDFVYFCVCFLFSDHSVGIMDVALDELVQKNKGGRGRGKGNNKRAIQARSKPYQRPSHDGGDEEYGVYIAGLPWRIAWQDLKDMCAEYGAVIYADVATEGGVPNGRSLGWGRVKFSTPGAQQRAINALNGAEIDGRYLEAREDLRG